MSISVHKKAFYDWKLMWHGNMHNKYRDHKRLTGDTASYADTTLTSFLRIQFLSFCS